MPSVHPIYVGLSSAALSSLSLTSPAHISPSLSKSKRQLHLSLKDGSPSSPSASPPPQSAKRFLFPVEPTHSSSSHTPTQQADAFNNDDYDFESLQMVAQLVASHAKELKKQKEANWNENRCNQLPNEMLYEWRRILFTPVHHTSPLSDFHHSTGASKSEQLYALRVNQIMIAEERERRNKEKWERRQQDKLKRQMLKLEQEQQEQLLHDAEMKKRARSQRRLKMRESCRSSSRVDVEESALELINRAASPPHSPPLNQPSSLPSVCSLCHHTCNTLSLSANKLFVPLQQERVTNVTLPITIRNLTPNMLCVKLYTLDTHFTFEPYFFLSPSQSFTHSIHYYHDCTSLLHNANLNEHNQQPSSSSSSSSQSMKFSDLPTIISAMLPTSSLQIQCFIVSSQEFENESITSTPFQYWNYKIQHEQQQKLAEPDDYVNKLHIIELPCEWKLGDASTNDVHERTASASQPSTHDHAAAPPMPITRQYSHNFTHSDVLPFNLSVEELRNMVETLMKDLIQTQKDIEKLKQENSALEQKLSADQSPSALSFKRASFAADIPDESPTAPSVSTVAPAAVSDKAARRKTRVAIKGMLDSVQVSIRHNSSGHAASVHIPLQPHDVITQPSHEYDDNDDDANKRDRLATRQNIHAVDENRRRSNNEHENQVDVSTQTEVEQPSPPPPPQPLEMKEDTYDDDDEFVSLSTPHTSKFPQPSFALDLESAAEQARYLHDQQSKQKSNLETARSSHELFSSWSTSLQAAETRRRIQSEQLFFIDREFRLIEKRRQERDELYNDYAQVEEEDKWIELTIAILSQEIQELDREREQLMYLEVQARRRMPAQLPADNNANSASLELNAQVNEYHTLRNRMLFLEQNRASYRLRLERELTRLRQDIAQHAEMRAHISPDHSLHSTQQSPSHDSSPSSPEKKAPTPVRPASAIISPTRTRLDSVQSSLMPKLPRPLFQTSTHSKPKHKSPASKPHRDDDLYQIYCLSLKYPPPITQSRSSRQLSPLGSRVNSRPSTSHSRVNKSQTHNDSQKPIKNSNMFKPVGKKGKVKQLEDFETFFIRHPVSDEPFTTSSGVAAPSSVPPRVATAPSSSSTTFPPPPWTEEKDVRYDEEFPPQHEEIQEEI